MNKGINFLKKSCKYWCDIRTPFEYQKQLKSKPEVQLDQYIRPMKPRGSISFFQKRKLAQRTAKLEPLKYKLQELSSNHNHLVPLGNVDHIPFFVLRTKSHNLPVYEMYK